MKLCSFQVDLRIPDDLDETEQDRLLEDVDAVNLPLRLQRCVRATLAPILAGRRVKVVVEK